MNSNKPRLIKDFEKLDESLQQQIKLAYPYGFSDSLIRFTNKDGKLISALPFETEEIYYMIRMSVKEAAKIVKNDDDYDDEGTLKESARDEYEEKYGDMYELSDNYSDDDPDF